MSYRNLQYCRSLYISLVLYYKRFAMYGPNAISNGCQIKVMCKYSSAFRKKILEEDRFFIYGDIEG